MDDPDIYQAMHLMYGPILDEYNEAIDPTGLLLFILASVIYHSPWLIKIVTRKPGHPFALIPLLNKPELLQRLKAKVHIEAGGQVSRVTGIPPHIDNAVLCTKLLTLCKETLVEVRSLTSSVRDAVSQVYGVKAIENGMLTGERLKEMFQSFHGEILQAIDSKIVLLGTALPQDDPQDGDSAERDNIFVESLTEEVGETSSRNVTHRLYTYEGKMWQVPKNFTFPTNTKLLTGWQLWVGGQPGYQVNKQSEEGPDTVQLGPVRPYRLLGRKFLPKQVRQVLSLSWDPIFSIMQAAPDMDFVMDAQESFKIGYAYLKARVEYIFTSIRMKPETWCVAYWSVRVQRSSIMKKGTEADKARLPAPTRKNAPRKQTISTSSDGRQVKRRRIRKNATVLPQLVPEGNPIADAALTPANEPIVDAALTPANETILEAALTPANETIPDAALTPAIITQEEEPEAPQQVPKPARSRRPIHQLMQQRKSTRKTTKKTKKKQQSQPSNDFANAFNDIPVTFVRRARESSLPPPPPPPPPPPRLLGVLPGMCGGCKKPVSNIHTCDICKHNMHVFCGLPIGEEGYGQKIRCEPCQRSVAV